MSNSPLSPGWSSEENRKRRQRSRSRTPTRHKKHKSHKEKKSHHRHHSDSDDGVQHRRHKHRHHKESRQMSPQDQMARVKKEPKDEGYERRERDADSNTHSHRHLKQERHENIKQERHENIKQEWHENIKQERNESRSDRHRDDHRHRDNPRRDREERPTHERRREQRRREERQNNNSPGGPEVWGRQEETEPQDEPPKDKEKPSFELSGKLTEDTNTYRGIVIKYNEPPEARKPKRRWRLYPFKGEEQLPVLHIHRQSAYLIGRERRVADLPVDHPSCSKQHAALQFRMVMYKKDDGRTGRRVRPYVIDLGSANGTYVNNQRIDPQRYVELLEKDVLKFGFSTREYVILHDKADTSELLDEVEEGDDS